MGRKPCCDKSGLRQGAWTPEEDRKLNAYVTRYGCWNWRQLPKYAGLARCGKSCRLRWMNYLRPNIIRGNYTQEEEETIIRLHESLGNRWSAIAAELPGRTDNEVKNHWHTTLKKRVKHKPSSITNDPVHKTEIELINHLLINDTITPPLIVESSLSSSSQPASSDQNSTIGTDNAVVSTNVDSVSDLFEAYEANSGNFWTQPFFSDSCFMSTDQMLLDTPPAATAEAYEAPFPFLDGSEILCPFDFYDLLDGFNF